MEFNSEMKIPYVSKAVCEYLRNIYNLPNVLYQVVGKIEAEDSAFALGMMMGINTTIERLEAIVAQQEGDKD